MTRLDWFAGLGTAWALTAAKLAAQGGTLPAIDQLELRGVSAATVPFEGREALRLVEVDASRRGGLAVLRGVTFTNGTIALDVAGRRGPHEVPADRGFIGVAFRTRMRIEVAGRTARLFVHDAAQPALVVTDLKLGTEGGGVGLWIGAGTEGFFSNMLVTPAP